MEDRRWYYRLVKSEDRESNTYSRALYEDYDPEHLHRRYIISKETDTGKRIYTLYHSHVDVYRLIAGTTEIERRYHEIIPENVMQKPRFDIDIDIVDVPIHTDMVTLGETVKDQLITAVMSVLSESDITLDLRRDISVYSSHGESKRSYHIILHSYCHCNSHEAMAFYDLVTNRIEGGQAITRWIDHGVYSGNTSLRMIWSHKLNKTRVKRWQSSYSYLGVNYSTIITIPSSEEHHRNITILGMSLITFTAGCYALPPYSTRVNKIYDDIELEEDTINQITQLISEKYEDTFVIMGVKGSLISLKRLQPSHCQICNRIHQAENPYCWVVEDCLYLNCRRAPKDKSQFVGRLSDVIIAKKQTEDEITPNEIMMVDQSEVTSKDPTSDQGISDQGISDQGIPKPKTTRRTHRKEGQARWNQKIIESKSKAKVTVNVEAKTPTNMRDIEMLELSNTMNAMSIVIKKEKKKNKERKKEKNVSKYNTNYNMNSDCSDLDDYYAGLPPSQM